MEHKVGELAACRDSLAIRRRLAGLDPTNAQWRHDEACILDHIGNVYRKAGKAQARNRSLRRERRNLASTGQLGSAGSPATVERYDEPKKARRRET